MSPKWRLVFMGTPQFAVPILEALLNSENEVIAVVTQPDKLAGRGKRLTPPPIKLLAKEKGLKVLQPQRLKDQEFLDQMYSLRPEAIVVAAYGKILPKVLLELPRYGCLNVHASLLPKLRGAAPINWAIITGERETGITIMQMDEGMDTGDIILQRAVTIGPEETAGELHDRLALLGAELIVEALKGLKQGLLTPKPQPEKGVSYAPPLKKEDGFVDFTLSAEELARLIRGLDPWPSAYAYFRGKLIKFFRPQVEEDQSHKGIPGEIVTVEPHSLVVATGQGLLKIREVQVEGKKRMPTTDFIRGWRPIPGERFEGR